MEWLNNVTLVKQMLWHMCCNDCPLLEWPSIAPSIVLLDLPHSRCFSNVRTHSYSVTVIENPEWMYPVVNWNTSTGNT